MQTKQINKLKGIIGITNKAGYIIFGTDNLKDYTKKLYLIVKSNDCGKNLDKVAKTVASDFNIECVEIQQQIMDEITNSTKCKIFGVKNKGLSEQILKIIRGENID